MKKIIKILFFLKLCLSLSLSFGQNIGEIFPKYDPILHAYGYINQTNQIIIPYEYQYAESFINDYAVVGNFDKFGIINKYGKLILPIEFNSIKNLTGNKALIMKNYQWYLFDCNLKTITEKEYDFVGDFNTSSEWVAPFRRDTLFGILDTNLHEIIIGNCDKLNNFSEGIAIYKYNGNSGYINKKGLKITAPIYSSLLQDFYKGKALFNRNDSIGVINDQGKEICIFDAIDGSWRLIFDSANYFIEIFEESDIIIGTNCKKYSSTNGYFYELIYPNYMKYFKDEVHLVEIYGNYISILYKNCFGIYDTSGNEIIPINYNSITPISYGGFIVNKDNTYALYKHNKMVLEPKYSAISPASGTLYNIILDRKNGICNYNGEIIIPIIYDITYPSVSNNMIKVELTGNKKLVGYYNVLGKLLIPLQFEDGEDFHEGLAAVKINGKWGFIDIQGTVVIPFEYDTVTSFLINRSFVMKNGLWGVINEDGTLLTELKYDKIDKFNEGFAIVYNDNGFGLINYEGKEIVMNSDDKYFHSISYFTKGYWLFHLSNNKIMKLSKKGDLTEFN